MFTVLVREHLKGPPLFHRRFRLHINREGDICFALLEMDDRGTPNWRKIGRVLGEGRNRVVAGNDLVLPEGFHPVDTSRFDRELMYNGLVCLLERTERRPGGVAVLVDLDSRYQHFAELLLHYFSSVHILTRTEGYRWFAERAFQWEGAAVTLSSSLRARPVLLVSPDSFLPPGAEGLPCPVVTPAPAKAVLQWPVHSFRVCPPPGLAALLPRGTDAHQFLAAAYEYCGKRRLAGLPPEKAMVGGKERNLKDGNVNFFHLDNGIENVYTKQL